MLAATPTAATPTAAVPGQPEAMLGEARSLSVLGRHLDAIAILDDMERLGTWYMGET